MHLSMVTCSTSCSIQSKQTVEHMYHQNPKQQKQHYSYRHTGLLAASETLYSKLATFVHDLLSVRRRRHTVRGKNLFRLWIADIRAPQSHEQDTRNAYVRHKPNNKMLRDSGFVYRVLTSLTTQTVLCCDILWHCL